MNEISIKVNLSYDSTTDEIIGLQDFGNGEKKQSGCNISPGIHGSWNNWQLEIATWLLPLETIDKVTSIGLKVKPLISDLGSNFNKTLKDLNITPAKPWFMHNSLKIVYIFDAPHVIKTCEE